MPPCGSRVRPRSAPARVPLIRYWAAGSSRSGCAWSRRTGEPEYVDTRRESLSCVDRDRDAGEGEPSAAAALGHPVERRVEAERSAGHRKREPAWVRRAVADVISAVGQRQGGAGASIDRLLAELRDHELGVSEG